jgi:hypothetical protein
MKISKRQLRRIIKEALETDRDFTAYGREDALAGRPESPPYPGGIGPDRREFHAYHNAYKKALLHQQDEDAAAEILNTRMGSYKGKTLPGGKKI